MLVQRSCQCNVPSYLEWNTVHAQCFADNIVVIVQENRSFDECFGVYPGVNGIPPGTRLSLARGSTQYVEPYLETNPNQKGGHTLGNLHASATTLARWMDSCGRLAKMQWDTVIITSSGTIGLTHLTSCCSTISSHPLPAIPSQRTCT